LPLYEYECPKDGTFEQIHKFSDPPLKACPTCGGPIEKLASAPAIQFKGTGWYVTDYAKKSGEKPKDSDTSKDSGSAGGSPDSKSASSSGGKSSSDAKGSSAKGSSSGRRSSSGSSGSSGSK